MFAFRIDRNVLASALLFALAAPACSNANEADYAGNQRSAIVGGEESPATDDFVVRIVPRFGFPCSATLLAPNVLVTAQHCIAKRELGTFGCTIDGSVAPPDLGPGRVGTPFDAADLQVFYGADPGPDPAAFGERVFASGSTSICNGDIALVVLDRDLPERGVAVRFDRPVSVEEPLTLIGYEPTHDDPPTLRARRTHVPVLAVAPDQPDGFTDMPPHSFLLGEGACGNDEGGPALSEETGAIVGLFTYTASGVGCYGLRNYYLRIAPFSELVETALSYAGRRVEREREPAPTPETDGSCSLARGANGGGACTMLLVVLGLAACRRKRDSKIASEASRRTTA